MDGYDQVDSYKQITKKSRHLGTGTHKNRAATSSKGRANGYRDASVNYPSKFQQKSIQLSNALGYQQDVNHGNLQTTGNLQNRYAQQVPSVSRTYGVNKNGFSTTRFNGNGQTGNNMKALFQTYGNNQRQQIGGHVPNANGYTNSNQYSRLSQSVGNQWPVNYQVKSNPRNLYGNSVMQYQNNLAGNYGSSSMSNPSNYEKSLAMSQTPAVNDPLGSQLRRQSNPTYGLSNQFTRLSSAASLPSQNNANYRSSSSSITNSGDSLRTPTATSAQRFGFPSLETQGKAISGHSGTAKQLTSQSTGNQESPNQYINVIPQANGGFDPTSYTPQTGFNGNLISGSRNYMAPFQRSLPQAARGIQQYSSNLVPTSNSNIRRFPNTMLASPGDYGEGFGVF